MEPNPGVNYRAELSACLLNEVVGIIYFHSLLTPNFKLCLRAQDVSKYYEIVIPECF